ncbi:protein lin-28-like [Actinia tenebrosa]|uniref:Protein lin-28-like n=1 Tax=Actinia tenebrosa TaxID=6105 RepID=A0A6P8IUF9_ACTTE|nr:protein lin-28-like [Actinia tenebrosa]XP_031569815.1 protein lin-28-like [Actinia tenebrosa]
MTDENHLNADDSEDSKFFGFVKWFNIAKGFGFITRNDGGEDFFVHQSAIKSNGYRTLVEGEQVSFKITDSDKGRIAVCVTSTDGGKIKSATRKTRTKQGARKYTSLCFNCNKGGHKAKKCPYERTTNRLCHKCGSNMHIIRKCPLVLAHAMEHSENRAEEQQHQKECGKMDSGKEHSLEKIEIGKIMDNHNAATVA